MNKVFIKATICELISHRPNLHVVDIVLHFNIDLSHLVVKTLAMMYVSGHLRSYHGHVWFEIPAKNRYTHNVPYYVNTIYFLIDEGRNRIKDKTILGRILAQKQ